VVNVGDVITYCPKTRGAGVCGVTRRIDDAEVDAPTTSHVASVVSHLID
jgi:hypothetical protein